MTQWCKDNSIKCTNSKAQTRFGTLPPNIRRFLLCLHLECEVAFCFADDAVDLGQLYLGFGFDFNLSLPRR